jgi:SNF2 family DNA or RNA helicase
VFYEKDVPEILSYLRSKATVRATKSADQIIVDARPLEYTHAVRSGDRDLEIRTRLTHPESEIEVTNEDQVKFVEGSKYVRVGGGFFGRPEQTEFKTFEPRIGLTKLSGDKIPLFLLYDLKRLSSHRRSTVDQDVIDTRVVTAAFEPRVSLDVHGPWIWFDVKYQAEEFSIPYQRVDQAPSEQQFLHEQNAWVKLDRGTHSRVAQRISEIPEVERVEDHFRTPSRHFYDVQSLFEQVAALDLSEAYLRFVKSLEDFSQIEHQPLPTTFLGQLRDYQHHGYNWICFLRKYGLNGILADEMGLGKTVQTLVSLLDTHAFGEGKASLIVCPPSVLSAWVDDIRKFTSVLDFRVGQYVGTNRAGVLRAINRYDVILTTYTIVVRDVEALSNVVWEYVVLDEAQKIKNYDTATAKACKRLVAAHKLAVTGTPIENRLSELWSIYDFLMPSYLGTHSSFRDRYEVPVMKRSDKNAADQLKKRIAPFKLRRLKSQVASELPEKIPMERYCELTPEQVRLYKEFALVQQEKIRQLPDAKVRIDVSILTAILRLKQICCHPGLVTGDIEKVYGRSGKMEAFLEILDELIENGEKALIFSQFTGMLQILRRVLIDRKLEHLYLDGTASLAERTRMKDEFQRGTVPFFLISLRAGGLGLTLTEANCVIHYDRWWNPAVEDQATDRAHRIGQTKPVKVFRIHTAGTIEDRIGELLVKKKDLFDTVIEVDDLRKEISKQDLLALFAPPKGSASN